ncbi:single-stranded-DNA-specific exonuclease RecJ [Nonlabens ulvanivorans]|uniref:Single-stranded-DNA-specific exonuclease RecJ n=1 Tax=Nonlabens ulvanivorans TaxID=906888 RepID=A0A090X257_NONUL|nr:single-stranded-DNA-specific exonuclease RecJ [Nonlabens ulvanivorans]
MTEKVMDTGYAKCVGKSEDHLKIKVVKKQNDRHAIDAIGFNLGKKIDIIKNDDKFDIAYTISENEWNGNVTLQLMLKDIKA